LALLGVSPGSSKSGYEVVIRRAVFLDRDGVINRGHLENGKCYAPRKVNDFHLLPYVRESVARLKGAGFLVFVITNQPDINNGLVSAQTVELMHDILRKKTRVDGIYVCPHTQKENCECRKPKPGLILKAAGRFDVELAESFVLGDRASDVEAGHAVGSRTIFIDRNYKERKPVNQEFTAPSIRSATSYILKSLKKRKL